LQLAQDSGLDRWLEGRLSDDQLARNLARIWAALPTNETNLSAYAGVSGNRAHIRFDDVLARLRRIQAEG